MALRILPQAPTRRTLLAGAAVAPIAVSALASAPSAPTADKALPALVERWAHTRAEFDRVELELSQLSDALDARGLFGWVVTRCGRFLYDPTDVADYARVPVEVFGYTAVRDRLVHQLSTAQRARADAWTAAGGDALEARWSVLGLAVDDLLAEILASPIRSPADAAALLRVVRELCGAEWAPDQIGRAIAALDGHSPV